ncbi:hypothetical protein GEMRC1_002016 [Eukaryota sp. GEM-RC1]
MNESVSSWNHYSFCLYRVRLTYKLQCYFNGQPCGSCHSLSNQVHKKLFKCVNNMWVPKFLVTRYAAVSGLQIYSDTLNEKFLQFLHHCGPNRMSFMTYDNSPIISDGIGVVPTVVGGITAVSQHAELSEVNRPSFDYTPVFELYNHHSTVECLSITTALNSLYRYGGLEWILHLFSTVQSKHHLSMTIRLLLHYCKSFDFRSNLSSRRFSGMVCKGLSLVFSSLNNLGESFGFLEKSSLIELMGLIGLEMNDYFDFDVFDSFLDSILIMIDFDPDLVVSFFDALVESQREELHSFFPSVLSFLARISFTKQIEQSIKNFFDFLLTKRDPDMIKKRLQDCIVILNCAITYPSTSVPPSNTLSCTNLILYIFQHLAHQACNLCSDRLIEFIKPSILLPFLNKKVHNQKVSVAVIRVALDFACHSAEWLKLSRDANANLWPCLNSFLLLFASFNAIGYFSLDLKWSWNADFIPNIDKIKNDFFSKEVLKNPLEVTSSSAEARCLLLSFALLKSLFCGRQSDLNVAELVLNVFWTWFSFKLPPTVTFKTKNWGSLPKRIDNLGKYIGDLVLLCNDNHSDSRFFVQAGFSVEALLMEEYDYDVSNDVTSELMTSSSPVVETISGFNQFSDEMIDEQIRDFPLETPINSDCEDDSEMTSPSISMSSSISSSLLRLCSAFACVLLLNGDETRTRSFLVAMLPPKKSYVSHDVTTITSTFQSICINLSSHLQPFLQTMPFNSSFLSALNVAISVISNRILALIKLIVEGNNNVSAGLELSIWYLSWIFGIFSSINKAIVLKVLKSGALSDIFYSIPLLVSYSSLQSDDCSDDVIGGVICKNLYLFLHCPDERVFKLILRFLLCTTLPSLLLVNLISSPRRNQSNIMEIANGFSFDQAFIVWQKSLNSPRP